MTSLPDSGIPSPVCFSSTTNTWGRGKSRGARGGRIPAPCSLTAENPFHHGHFFHPSASSTTLTICFFKENQSLPLSPPALILPLYSKMEHIDLLMQPIKTAFCCTLDAISELKIPLFEQRVRCTQHQPWLEMLRSPNPDCHV